MARSGCACAAATNAARAHNAIRQMTRGAGDVPARQGQLAQNREGFLTRARVAGPIFKGLQGRVQAALRRVDVPQIQLDKPKAGIAPRARRVPVRVTTPAKTVADCFKYRHKIGLDIALEALREGWRDRRFSLDELEAMARVDRVANVMRPYLEFLV